MTAHTYSCFEVKITDKVAEVILNRPDKRNAMNADFWRELPQLIRQIDSQAEARVIVISARGPVFCAGIDISMIKQPGEVDKNHPHYALELHQRLKSFQDSINALEECRIPVIAALNGACLGGGVDMITACDMRFGTTNSFISIFEIMVAITADVGTFPRIMNFMSEGVVRELAYSGREMPAQECERRGLFNAVYENEVEMMEAVMSLARQIASRSPSAIFGCKRAITYGRDHTTADALDHVLMWCMSMQHPCESEAAMMAMKTKTNPEFMDLPKLD